MPEFTVKGALQAALLVAEVPLSLNDLRKLFSASERPETKEIQAALAELESECAHCGFSLVQVSGGWRYQVDAEYAKIIGRLWERRPPRYSAALLETLALIAYRQPITRGEIERVRGVASSTQIMQTLTERNWVCVTGYKQTPGRPALYATTRDFLDYFGLKSLKELPALPDLPSPEEADPQLPMPELSAPEPSDETPEPEADDAP